MKNNIETIMEDSLSLKKALHKYRMENEGLNKQNQQLNNLLSQDQKRHQLLKKQHSQLQKKYQFAVNQSNKNLNTFMAQVQELKDLVQSKQRQIEDIQIKMIPNLDQDMIRVKLISEMQGPYQETVDKKNKEINKIKDKNHQLQRKIAILQLSLATKTKEYQRDIEHNQRFYQKENERLCEQINHLLAKSQVKNIDKDLVRSQRKQIEQLRYHIESKEEELQNYYKINAELRNQRDQLMVEISSLRSQSIIIMSKNINLSDQNIKQERLKFQRELELKSDENQKNIKKFKNLQRDSKRMQEEYQKEHNLLKQKYQREKDALKDQINNLKQDYIKLKEFKFKYQHDSENYSNKLKNALLQCQQLKRQCQILRTKIKYQQNQSEQAQIKRNSNKKKQNQQKKESEQKRQSEQKRNYSPSTEKQVAQFKLKIKNLQAKVQKLTIKLETANKKIIQLIKQKGRSSKEKRFSPQRDVNHTYQSSKNDFIQLQYRDAALFPLIPPTLYQHLRSPYY